MLPKRLQRAASEGQGERALPSSPPRRLHSGSARAQLQQHQPSRVSDSDSAFPTSASSGGGRFREDGQRTASVHALPTPQKQLKSLAHDCQVPPSNLVDILIEERIPRGPQRKCPMSGNVCFHFLLPSMNSTHGNGLGLITSTQKLNPEAFVP